MIYFQPASSIISAMNDREERRGRENYKKSNILRTKNVFSVKWKASFIIFKYFLLISI